MRGNGLVRAGAGAWVLGGIVACASSRSGASNGASSAPAPAAEARASAPSEPSSQPWSGATSVASNAGAYRVFFRPSRSPIPRGELFGLDVWIFDARDPMHPLRGVALAVDAGMPEHQHGMNRRASVRGGDDNGAFHVDGLLFHMPGRWDIYFDVTRGAITERAQASVELL
jgi:hypothetical protein